MLFIIRTFISLNDYLHAVEEACLWKTRNIEIMQFFSRVFYFILFYILILLIAAARLLLPHSCMPLCISNIELMKQKFFSAIVIDPNSFTCIQYSFLYPHLSRHLFLS